MVGERLKATTGKCWKCFLQRLEESNKMFFDDVRDVRKWWIKTDFTRRPGRCDTCQFYFLDETLPDWKYYPTTLKDKVGRVCDCVDNTLSQTGVSDSPFDNFPLDESMLFTEDLTTLPPSAPMDAYEQVKNSWKSVTQFANARRCCDKLKWQQGPSYDELCASIVHDLQVHKNAEKSLLYLRPYCWASFKRNNIWIIAVH